MRRFVGVPPWHSASEMFVRLGVRGFHESLRFQSYSLKQRLETSENLLCQRLRCSSALNISLIYECWDRILLA